VDWQSAMVAAGDYQLTGHEEVLWGYGAWPTYPTKLELDSEHVSSGASVVARTKYYDGSTWQAWPQASVHFGDQTYESDSNGQLNITLTADGVYPIWAEADISHVRSDKAYLTVGSGVSQAVDLVVNIPSSGGSDEDRIAFSVSQSNINFGDLRAGQSAESILSLTNTGNVPIHVEASVLGDKVFTDSTKLNQLTWPEFNLSLNSGNSQPLTVGLSLPSNTTSTGQKTGQLIFWASR